ncbi:glycosyltransferase family 1 protein [Ectothiorhodospiraceae bacterium WFHF3C12]|nr:glycosyltransferase family 1 protein [Ectothiorhodospiraceae bacterium WFHF3C12]
MRVAIVTDAWRPQVNGVVTTLSKVSEALEQAGHTVRMVTPAGFRTVAMPTYPEIRLSLWPRRRLSATLDAFAPEAIHIATEGPLGHAARRYCLRRGYPFTTAYHTQFPRYVRMRLPVPVAWTYAYLQRFHRPARRTMVPTPTMMAELREHGFEHVVQWTRGVDTALFHPREKAFLDGVRPISIFVGRVAVEKNVEAFLRANIPGTKYVVGDGPDAETLRRRYPDARFVGYRHGQDLARHVAAADVMVFPSRTDTFGLTMLEAMACGVPVAAYPVTGPMDVVDDGVTGALDEDLQRAVERALNLDPDDCVARARRRTWAHSADQFAGYLARFEPASPGAGAQPERAP